MTWRLWDASTYQELLLQEGHAKGVFCLSFQCDGSLVCSGGMDSLAMIWDIRSGNKVMSLTGHSKPVYTVDWSPNGYQVATGGGDGLINVWDIRQRDGGQVHQILAHRNIVTKVQFSKDDNGKKLISCGYDNLINVYSSDNWLKVASLEGHTDKIISLDISNDSKYLVSGGLGQVSQNLELIILGCLFILLRFCLVLHLLIHYLVFRFSFFLHITILSAYS